MTKLWTILGVADVAYSTAWYQSLLGVPQIAPAHDYFGQVVDHGGTVLLCLHRWGEHEHPSLLSAGTSPAGNGLLIFFWVTDLAAAFSRAKTLSKINLSVPHVDAATGTAQFSLQDPDGYYVTLSAERVNR